MPRITCPKCKLSFSQQDPNRKSTECPDCGYRILMDRNDAPRPPSRRTKETPLPKAKGRTPVLLIVGGVFLLLLGIGAVGGGVWYFKFRDRKPVAKVDDTPPNEVAPEGKHKLKRFKPAPPPELADTEIYPKLLPATVWIRFEAKKVVMKDGKRVPAIVAYSGSGVLICQNPNLVLTNRHVVTDPDTDRVQPTVDVYFPELRPNGQPEVDADFYLQQKSRLVRTGYVVKSDPRRDTAILRLETVPENANPIPMAAESAQRWRRSSALATRGSSATLFGAATAATCATSKTRIRTPAKPVDS